MIITFSLKPSEIRGGRKAKKKKKMEIFLARLFFTWRENKAWDGEWDRRRVVVGRYFAWVEDSFSEGPRFPLPTNPRIMRFYSNHARLSLSPIDNENCSETTNYDSTFALADIILLFNFFFRSSVNSPNGNRAMDNFILILYVLLPDFPTIFCNDTFPIEIVLCESQNKLVDELINSVGASENIPIWMENTWKLLVSRSSQSCMYTSASM